MGYQQYHSFDNVNIIYQDEFKMNYWVNYQLFFYWKITKNTVNTMLY